MTRDAHDDQRLNETNINQDKSILSFHMQFSWFVVCAVAAADDSTAQNDVMIRNRAGVAVQL